MKSIVYNICSLSYTIYIFDTQSIPTHTRAYSGIPGAPQATGPQSRFPATVYNYTANLSVSKAFCSAEAGDDRYATRHSRACSALSLKILVTQGRLPCEIPHVLYRTVVRLHPSSRLELWSSLSLQEVRSAPLPPKVRCQPSWQPPAWHRDLQLSRSLAYQQFPDAVVYREAFEGCADCSGDRLRR